MSGTSRRHRGEGSTYFHTGRQLWAMQIDLGKDARGKRVRRTVYAKSRAELRGKVADLKIRGGGSIPPRAVGTVGGWMKRWLAEIEPTVSSNTYALYEIMWRVHAQPILDPIPLEKFDVEHVSMLYARLRANGCSTSVIDRTGTVMQRAFEVAIKQRVYMRVNPFRLVTRPKHETKEARSLTAEEAQAFLAAAQGDRFEALWVLCLTAGLRLGEALALEWDDVDFKTQTLSVRRSLIEVNGNVQLGKTKTKGSKRGIVLGALAIAALLRRLQQHDQEGHGSKMIFCTMHGGPMRRSNLRRSHFIPILDAAKLGRLRIHDLRHSMTSLALSTGIAPKVLAERLGHSTTRLTQDRYSHVLPTMQRGAAEAIDTLLTPKKPKKERRQR